MIINISIDNTKIEFYSEPNLVEAKLVFMGRMFKGEGSSKSEAIRSLKAKIEQALQA